MSETRHERPGVYSVYDASAVFSAGHNSKTVAVAAKAAQGTVGQVVDLTRYSQGIAVFGEDGAEAPGMAALLRLLFANGVSHVVAVRVADSGELNDYQAAFALLEQQDAQIVLCDSADLAVQQALRQSVVTASETRRERIAVVGGDGEDVSALTTRAAALNSERVVLVGGDVLDHTGKQLPGVFGAAAVAGVIAVSDDPAVPLNGAVLAGLTGVVQPYNDNEIDVLVRGGVTPLECESGMIYPVRGITTRTKTAGAADATWRELTTILVVDNVIPSVRSALRSKFNRAKNTAQSRSAIRSQTIVELERKVQAEIIDSYDGVSVTASADDPTVCLVEFGFAVAHGLNRIYLTVHITV